MPIPNPTGDPAASPQPHAGPRVELELPLPPGGAAPFDLAAAVCSHGLFMMAPNGWDPAARALVRPLRLASDRSVSLLARVSAHPARPGTALLVAVEGAGALSSLDQDYILEQVRRMLRLSEEDGAAVAEFQAMHAAARRRVSGASSSRPRCLRMFGISTLGSRRRVLGRRTLLQRGSHRRSAKSDTKIEVPKERIQLRPKGNKIEAYRRGSINEARRSMERLRSRAPSMLSCKECAKGNLSNTPRIYREYSR
ncbi:uncharacterized protein C2845_PM11G10830 [Panicum miliaceum]|uniref:Uncharacterized protein n=1 Tax=Panicum miliaceum TaxID=4540 RepID=A0A3L6RUC6_PANMI|nr:uncharacterized protein C2845_PM11G10830 [Panicum miliaceum]